MGIHHSFIGLSQLFGRIWLNLIWIWQLASEVKPIHGLIKWKFGDGPRKKKKYGVALALYFFDHQIFLNEVCHQNKISS